MSKLDDLTGKVFNGGMITVTKRAENRGRKTRWTCLCKCGNQFTAYGHSLRAGLTKSCGCLRTIERSKGKLKDTSARIGTLLENSGDPYQNLANAIVAVAADDYRIALQDNNDKLIKSLESFFFSDWYGILTSVNPEFLVEKLQKEAKDHTNNICI